MSKLTVKKPFYDRVDKVLHDNALKVGGESAGILLENIFANTPIEDGHAHQAWGQAFGQLLAVLGPYGNRIRTAIANNQSHFSGDPQAKGAGHARIGRDKLRLLITNTLDFVGILERGGTIYPKTKFRKQRPAALRPREKGSLYGPREREGTGMVFWEENGKSHFATARPVKRGDYVKKALVDTKRRMKPLKPRRI